MAEIHMGKLLEQVVRRKGLNITELCRAIGINRRTMYNWFTLPQLSVATLQKISKVVVYDFGHPKSPPTIVAATVVDVAEDFLTLKNEEYWKDKYIDLLERYSTMLDKTLSEETVLVET